MKRQKHCLLMILYTYLKDMSNGSKDSIPIKVTVEDTEAGKASNIARCSFGVSFKAYTWGEWRSCRHVQTNIQSVKQW